VKLLLDTQTWLWWFAQPERLNKEVIAQIADEANQLWLSVASVWEMAIKAATGKLQLPVSVDKYIAICGGQLDVKSLEIKPTHALRAAALPSHHRDPFDRMLIAQSQLEGMTLVSADSALRLYSDVSMLWAAA
jgi:PIN domain nuclease of toxin-antitoxin system